jgi:multisubunit Na+/H+ antiporter MnhG subunit
VRDAIATTLLIAGVGVQTLGSLGVLLMRDTLDRLHYLGAAPPAALLVVAAVLVHDGPSLVGNKSLALAAFAVVTSPVLAHVTGRTIQERPGRGSR